jgi:hypothetical protein
MAIEMTEKEIYEAARKRVEEKKGFFIHLAVYVVINLMLILLWKFAAGGGYPWFFWSLGGWAIGLVFHFLSVFVFSKQSGWERREIEKEMEKIRHSG